MKRHLEADDAQPLGNEPVYHRGAIVDKSLAIALIDSDCADKLDVLEVDVDIAGSQNAGILSISAAWDADGSAPRKPTG